MECKSCTHRFTMLEIPIERRIYGPLSAMFPCPKCDILLQADKRFKILSIIGMTFFSVGAIGHALIQANVLDIHHALMTSSIILGIAGVALSLKNTGTEIVR